MVNPEAARKLIEALDLNIKDNDPGNPHFKDLRVKTFPLTQKGFKSIKASSSNRRLAFVDGGNEEIIGAPNFSIQLNRVYVAVWDGQERITLDLPRIEFFSAVYAKPIEGDIHYETIVIPSLPKFEQYLPDSEDLSVSSFDKSIMMGNQRAEPRSVGAIARRFAEWKLASKAVEHLSEGDILVMDGSIQTVYTNEGMYKKMLFDACKENKVVVTGLAKTSSLFTTTGLPLFSVISKLSEDHHIPGNWYYKVAESTSQDHNAVLLAVKLNPIADRVFRFEFQRDQFKIMRDEEIGEILSRVCENSSDAAMPGYPYGLIDADTFARVSFDELEYYRGIVLSEMSGLGNWLKFARHIRASDAHSVLNMLMR